MNVADLEPVFGHDAYPVSASRMAEHRENLRIAAQTTLDRSNGGRDLVPTTRAWALHWAAAEPIAKGRKHDR